MSGPVKLTGEQYIELLLARQAEWLAAPGRPDYRYPPLLEWFVRAGDENLVDLTDA